MTIFAAPRTFGALRPIGVFLVHTAGFLWGVTRGIVMFCSLFCPVRVFLSLPIRLRCLRLESIDVEIRRLASEAPLLAFYRF